MITSPEAMEGVLPVDKPTGPTSHDAVMIARRALHTRRIGHTGTLDPFASGLLLLCVGRATRIAEYLAAQSKSYRAVLRLGEETDTDDLTGNVTARSDAWRDLDAAAVEDALDRERGRRAQLPPAFSAKKLAGERLYERARRGEDVTPPSVDVEVFDIRLVAWSPPDAAFEVTCSSGTYVRAIGRDVGRRLGCFGHLVSLRRTAVGSIGVERAIPLETLREQGTAIELIPPLEALAHLPRVDVDDVAAAAIRHGRAVATPAPLALAERPHGPGQSPARAATGSSVPLPTVTVAWQGELLAIGEWSDGRLQPRKVLANG